MNIATATSGAAQLIGGLALAPLLPGLIQHWKARLQGRRGPSPVQPYRELRRLVRKSTVTVEGSTVLYRVAPALAAASVATAVLMVPVSVETPTWGIGQDVLVVLGLLALARFAVAAAAWDVGNGFTLMGASRDLTLSVSIEVTLILALAVSVLVAGSTDLSTMIAATSGGDVWANPALALGAVTFALAAIAELGRQPVDNPDTHLELTMIHEAPLLEYAGPDLAYLQWTSAVRHWLLLILAAGIFLPHAAGVWWQLAVLPLTLIVLCAVLALVETLVAKLRILLVPRLLGVGAVVALLGIVARLVGMR